MLRIAICDDNVRDMHAIAKLIASYNDTHYTQEIEVQQFSHSLELVKKLQNGVEFDLYLLDILMPQRSGIELAKLIREQQGHSVIAFTTSSGDYALDAFGVLAQRYLLKPIEKRQLFETVDYACTFSNVKTSKIFPFKTPDGIISIPYRTILYAECAARMIHLHCVDESTFGGVYIRRNFESEIAPLLQDPMFVQTHKSYAVNLEHVGQFRTTHFIMDDGSEIPIARKRQVEVKRVYLKFLAEYGN